MRFVFFLKVTTLEIVSCVGGAVMETKCLNKNLRYLFGIVSVGTEEGHIYLVDLRSGRLYFYLLGLSSSTQFSILYK